jgi:hypothetical protein
MVWKCGKKGEGVISGNSIKAIVVERCSKGPIPF